MYRLRSRSTDGPMKTLHCSLISLFVCGAMASVGLAQTKKVDFVRDIAPILVTRCIECHNADEPEADLRLDIKSGLFSEDKDDWTVTPGASSKSLLFERITLPSDDEEIMPPEGKPLTAAEIASIKRWIDEGAEWPDGADAKLAALIPVSRPKIEKIELPSLTAEQESAEVAAIAAIVKAGGLASRISAIDRAAEVSFSLLGDQATSATVELISGLERSLLRLNLSRTKIDDASCATIGGLSELRWLNLSRTQLSDKGLRQLKNLSKLRYLNLYGTEVTDAGLSSLHGLTDLRKLYLWQTKVSKKGALALRRAMPNLQVNLGGYAELLAKTKPGVAKTGKSPVNTNCPVTGKALCEGVITSVRGQSVGFCCDKCKAAFVANPDKYLPKLEGVLKKQ